MLYQKGKEETQKGKDYRSDIEGSEFTVQEQQIPD